MNSLTDNFLKAVLEASWQGSLVIVLILLLRPLLGQRVPARWRYALWSLVLVRLLVPAFVLPRSPASLQNLAVVDRPFEQAARVFADATGPAPVPIEHLSQGPDETGAAFAAPAPAPIPKRSWWRIAAVIWVAGAALTGGWILAGTLLLHRRLRRDSSEVGEEIRRIWQRCCGELGLRRVPRLLVTGCVASPALVGLWRPALLLPRTELASFSGEDWEHVFLHELAHFRRRDHWSQALQLAGLCVHWFNPLVWFGFRCLRTDRELAADEWALRHLQGERSAGYGETLLKVLTAQARVGFTPGLVGITEDGAQMKQRLRHIVSFTPRRLVGSLAGVVIALAMAAVVLGQSTLKVDLSGYAGLSPIDTLVTAARRGDQPVVEKMLADGVDVNGLTSLRGERTALAAATAAKQLEALRLLVDKGANLELQPEKTDTAVVIAWKRGWTDCAEYLLSKGAVGEPEMLAAAKGDAAVIDKLLKAKTADFAKLKALCEVAAANGQTAIYAMLDGALRDTPAPVDWEPTHGMMIAAVANGHRATFEAMLQGYPNMLQSGVVRLGGVAARTPGMTEWLRAKGCKVPDYNDGERLIDAAEREDLPEIRRLIAKGTDINYRGESDWTPLFKAGTWGSPKAVKLLLENKADPNQLRYEHYSTLELAKTPEIAEMLFAAGVKLRPGDIRYGLYFNSVELAKWFLDHGVPIKEVDESGATLLFAARRPEIAELLIARGVDVKAKDQSGTTALEYALQGVEEPAEVVAVLLKHGADPNARRPESGYTPLMFAPDGASVDVLVAAGADLQAKDNQGNGVLAAGWPRSKPSRMDALIHHGLKLEAEESGKLLVDAIILRHDIAAVKTLLARGINPDIGDRSGGRPSNSPISAALCNGSFEIVDVLRAAGAKDVGLLSEAAARGDLARMTGLLDGGAKVNERSSFGYTPLHFAVRQGQAGAVRLLLERGANVSYFDNIGLTALTYARFAVSGIEHEKFSPVRRLDLAAGKKAFDEIVALIQERKADPNFRNDDGETALMCAAKMGNLVSVLEGVNVNLQRPDGMTALMLVIVARPKDDSLDAAGTVHELDKDGKPGAGFSLRAHVVKTLIKNGADLSIRNAAGKTALDLARENGNPEILELLAKAAEKGAGKQ